MSKISIVIPCYFNELNIQETYRVIVSDVFEKCPEIEFEIVFVDDGSKDNTLLELKKVQNIDHRIKIVKLTRNFGEFRAIVAGMQYTTGDGIVVMSADLQDPPSLIPQMIESWKKGNKVTLSVRNKREESWLKNTLANTYYKIVRHWVEENYPKQGFDFFLIDKEVKDKLVLMQEKNSSIYVQLIWLGYTPFEIEYTRRDREQGKSMWSYRKRINLFIDTFIVFSYKPIRFISTIGIIVSLIGFIFAILFIIEFFIKGVDVAGWTSVIVATLLLSGFQMIMLGVIGEYMWRNLDESRKRPLYVVDEVIETDSIK